MMMMVPQSQDTQELTRWLCMTTMIIVYQHHRWSRSSIVAAAAHGWTSSKNAWNAPSQTFGTPRKLQTKKDERKKWRTGSDWYARRVRFELFFLFIFFKFSPIVLFFSLPVPGIFSRVHRHVVRRQFPPCSFDGKGKWDALPACWQFTSSPRPCPRFSLFYFIFFFLGGHARRERAAAAVGVIDGRTADFSYFFFSHHEKMK